MCAWACCIGIAHIKAAYKYIDAHQSNWFMPTNHSWAISQSDYLSTRDGQWTTPSHAPSAVHQTVQLRDGKRKRHVNWQPEGCRADGTQIDDGNGACKSNWDRRRKTERDRRRPSRKRWEDGAKKREGVQLSQAQRHCHCQRQRLTDWRLTVFITSNLAGKHTRAPTRSTVHGTGQDRNPGSQIPESGTRNRARIESQGIEMPCRDCAPFSPASFVYLAELHRQLIKLN